MRAGLAKLTHDIIKLYKEGKDAIIKLKKEEENTSKEE